MASETSLMAKEVRLLEWTNQIRECQNRPSDMKVGTWCAAHGISKANYYYRLRRVREACLGMCEPELSFVELQQPAEIKPAQCPNPEYPVVGRLTASGGISIELSTKASEGFLRNLIGALRHAE